MTTPPIYPSSTERAIWPLGPCPPGTPLAVTKNFTPRMCIVGTSETFGLGTPSGNSYRKALNTIATSCGMTITWVGNVSNGDAPSNESRGVVGATALSHQSGGATDTVQYFGIGGALHPCDGFLFELGTNDGANGAADPLATGFATNLSTLASQLQAKEPAATFGSFLIEQGGDATRNAGIAYINANQMASAWAAIRGAGSLLATADGRTLTQQMTVTGPQYLGTEGPSWLHWDQIGCLLKACAIWPIVCNMFGFSAVWPGDPLT